jgi:hypothetical protein
VNRGESLSALCREYAITRPTGYLWLRRFQQHGVAGVEERSRQVIAFQITVKHHSCMATEKPHPRRNSSDAFPSSIKLIDALPSWAKVIFLVLGGTCFLYSIAHYGLGTTLLHAIFSP